MLSISILTSTIQIVDKRSAVLGLAGNREKQIAVNCDHSLICKFASMDDPACELAIGTIAAELKRALNLQSE